jgi:hypothetical protein
MYRSIDGYSGGSCLVTPLEMDKIANYLRDNGFEEDLISKLFDNYKKTDEEYHDTNIKRDKDGHIIGLSKTIGYRDEEVKVFVNNSGYSHVVATKKLQQAMTDVMQNIDRSSLGRDIYNVKADIQTVQLMINEAAKKLSEKEASLFLKEFADIAQKMSTQHRYD